jgi:hypothetical protein
MDMPQKRGKSYRCRVFHTVELYNFYLYFVFPDGTTAHVEPCPPLY